MGEARNCAFEVAGEVGERHLTLLVEAGVAVASSSKKSTVLTGRLSSDGLDEVLSTIRDLGLELLGFRAGPSSVEPPDESRTA